MRTFEEFKQDVVENFQENYPWFEEETTQMKECITFNDLAEILVSIEYWEESDAKHYGEDLVS